MSRRKPVEIPGDPSDPQGMIFLLNGFLESMRVRNFSEATVRHREYYIRVFIRWCGERGLFRPADITKPIIERFQRYLFHYRKANGDPVTFRTQEHHLVSARMWFKWLARNNFILYNPASEIELPRLEYRLPKFVLTASESDLVINQADVNTLLGLRDRASMETFYSTGMRRKELAGLRVYDLDSERGTIMIRQGKGKKDRVVPVGERALAWIARYTQEVRPGLLVAGVSGDTLFLTEHGEAFPFERLTTLVGAYVAAADIGKKGSCHLFRHAMATLMLENGADIRFVQAMLGHARLDTTVIYTKVSIRKLKEIHTVTHPASRHRSEMRQEAVLIPEAAHQQLRTLAAKENAKLNDLLLAGLDLLFAKKGLGSIAELCAAAKT
jgi:integrase/recombinase XerD